MPENDAAVSPPHVRIMRFFERHLWLGDTLWKVLPLVLLSQMIWVLSGPGRGHGHGFFGTEVYIPAMVILDLLAVVPLALSRIRPGLAAGIIAFACICQLLALYGVGMSAFSVPLIVYACAKFGSRRVSRGYLILALFGAVLLGLFCFLVLSVQGDPMNPLDPGWSGYLAISLLITGFSATTVLAAWLFGDLAGRRRREREAIEEKNRLLERERDQEARLAADAERMRIAREMHDVVSHSMSVMIAQADGGRYVIDQDPVRAGEAFETIGATGREALTELRRMLGVLREEGELKKRPAPGVNDLPRLVEDVRASGLEVELNIAQGSLPELNEGVQLAIYRIVQEALTNTLKHGGAEATAEIWLGTDHRSGELALEVRDTGQGATDDDGAGSGLLGMAERAKLYGGSLVARPKGEESLESGFVVEARFPLSRVRQPASGQSGTRAAQPTASDHPQEAHQ